VLTRVREQAVRALSTLRAADALNWEKCPTRLLPTDEDWAAQEDTAPGSATNPCACLCSLMCKMFINNRKS